MIRMMLAGLVAVLGAGCAASPGVDPLAPCLDPGRAADGRHDDRRIVRDLQREAGRLIKGERTVPAEKLRGQLDRRTCRVALAPAAGGGKINPGEIYRTKRDGVVIVAGMYTCPRCTEFHPAPASGFIISADGIVVTNYHVMESRDRATFVVGLADGTVLPVREVLAASRKDDLAILRIDPPEGKPLVAFPIGPDAGVGEPVSIISHPDRKFFTLTCGIVSRQFDMHSRGRGHVPMFSVTADFARGSSGAPVLDGNGAAVGIVASTNSVYYEEHDDVQVNLQMVVKQCVPASSLRKLIEE